VTRLSRTLAAAILALGSAALGRALDPSTPLTQFGHDVWTSDSGLPQNSVTTILQTRDGYLWLGTQEGLVRFDGVRFTIFDTRNTKTLRDDWVQTLCQTADGTLWIGTVTGLVRMKDGQFLPGIGPGLGRAQIDALHESRDGSLWVGSDIGVSRIRDGKVTTYAVAEGLPAPRAQAIAEDANGDLWVGGSWGIARLEGSRFAPWTVREGFPGSVFALLTDPDGGLWAGTGRGLVHLDGRSSRLYARPEGLTHPMVQVLYRDRDANLWLGTEGGLFRFRDGRFLRHGADQGLSSDRIFALHEDREGSLWIGTSDGGLNRLKEQRLAIYTTRDGLSDDKLWSVFEDRRGSLWAGTAEGVLHRLAPGSDRFEPFVNVGASVMAIAEDAHGDLWIGTRGAGLVHLRGKRLTRYTAEDGLSGSWISSVLVDRAGTVWAGTFGSGVNRLENGKFVHFRVREGLGADAIFSLFQDRDGAIWIGTFGGGVTRLAGGRFTTFTMKDGLAHDVVMSTYQDSEGTYWFATRGGLCRYGGGRFTTYRQREGLFHDAAQRVLEDGRGYLWLTSNRGVFRVSTAELAAAAAESGSIGDHVTFTTATGMIRAECNNAQHGAFRGRDGRLWFATVKGLAMADPARIELNPVPPAVVVEQVLADGQPISAPGRLRLPAGTGKLELGYTALAFRNPLAVRFRYRLEGFEKDWVDAGTRRTAYYTNLAPGHYRFRVRAANEDGVWNETGAALDFTLARHAYQTVWFRAVALIVFAVLVTLGYRLRVRRLEVRERLRTALVEAQLDALQFQLRPHFLFNTLNSILPLVGKDPERARQMVVRLGELLRLSLRSEDTPLVTLEEEIEILEKYLSIERVRFRDRLDVTIAIEPAVASSRVPTFLLQPLVENAIKHGLGGRVGRGRITISAREDAGRLAISVRDNGPGPKHGAGEDTTAGIGLRNTRRRLEALYPDGHLLELVAAEGGGAEVRVRIPLTRAALLRVETPPLRPAAAPVSQAS
jgi:ligand-binding sensor domain-containing protein/signal transduction histidine kinase